MIVFVHCDAEGADLATRLLEFENVERQDVVARLAQLLLAAAGDLTGRRAKQFKAALPAMRVNVASLITDYSQLESLSAFGAFQTRLAKAYPYRIER